MRSSEPLPDPLRRLVEGAALVEALFDGRWPAFHDAEITRIELDRTGPTVEFAMSVPWRAQWHHIEIVCVDVQEIVLSDFNHQNVLAELTLTGDGEALSVHLHGIYGLSGIISCKRIRVQLPAEAAS